MASSKKKFKKYFTYSSSADMSTYNALCVFMENSHAHSDKFNIYFDRGISLGKIMSKLDEQEIQIFNNLINDFFYTGAYFHWNNLVNFDTTQDKIREDKRKDYVG